MYRNKHVCCDTSSLSQQRRAAWMGLEGRREKPLLFYAQPKENPAKGRVFLLLVGRVS
jgi:hypothetical protein